MSTNEKTLKSLADALETIARVLNEAASSPAPSSPEAASVGLPDSDEAQAITAFRGKVVVTLDDVRFMTGWGRERILALVQDGSIQALPGTGSAGGFKEAGPRIRPSHRPGNGCGSG